MLKCCFLKNRKNLLRREQIYRSKIHSARTPSSRHSTPSFSPCAAFLKPYSITTYQNTHAPAPPNFAHTAPKSCGIPRARKTSQSRRTPTVLRLRTLHLPTGYLPQYCVIRFSQALTTAVQYGKIGKSNQATKRKGKHYEGQLPLFNEKRA